MKKGFFLLLIITTCLLSVFAQTGIFEFETHGFNTIKYYEVNDNKYCMFYNSESGTLRVYDNSTSFPNLNKTIYSENIFTDWQEFIFIEKWDTTYLFRYKKDGNIKVQKINSDGSFGDLTTAEKWDAGYTDFQFFQLGDKTNPLQYIIMTNPGKGKTITIDLGTYLN